MQITCVMQQKKDKDMFKTYEYHIEDMEESRENLEGLVQRLTIQNDALVAASEIYKVVLVLCKEALMNVPVVGKPYDQQHSDFQMNAYNIVIEALEQVK